MVAPEVEDVRLTMTAPPCASVVVTAGAAAAAAGLVTPPPPQPHINAPDKTKRLNIDSLTRIQIPPRFGPGSERNCAASHLSIQRFSGSIIDDSTGCDCAHRKCGARMSDTSTRS